MKDFYDFASGNPWLTFFLVIVFAGVLNGVRSGILIIARGWPPPHVDEDGDEK